MSQSQLPSAQDIDRMVTEVVQYLLIMEQKKFPVKKQELTKLLNLKGNSLKTFRLVLSASDKYLEEVFSFHVLSVLWFFYFVNSKLQVFGYKITEFEEKSAHYILVNQIRQHGTFSTQQFSDTNTILFLILTAIYLAEGQIIEGNGILLESSYLDRWWNKLCLNIYVEILEFPYSLSLSLNFFPLLRTEVNIILFSKYIFIHSQMRCGTCWIFLAINQKNTKSLCQQILWNNFT